MEFQRLGLSAYTLTTAAGCGVAQNLDALQNKKSGLRKNNFQQDGLDTWVGRVDGIEQIKLPTGLTDFSCRNNQLALLALDQDEFEQRIDKARRQYGASRIGVFIGTSTSGGLSTEQAYAERQSATDPLPTWYQYRKTENPYSITDFVQQYLQLSGPAFTIATACSSSAKVFAAAHRYISLGICDAAIVGGVDSLCDTILYGFNSLQLISRQICKPWDVNRAGINIGEAAGFGLLEKQQACESGVTLFGYGESSDAYHMSTPHPEGAGAVMAMQKALACNDTAATDIDYVNLHGTGTRANDTSEDKAIQSVCPASACSSTKGWTGHTLGAAGIVEALFTSLSIEHDFLPCNLNLDTLDPDLNSHILLDNRQQKVRMCLSNSFGFGGSNCSLLFGKSS
jgi:3-oxoacyl-[acyl-carrier-protein] synthase-1